MVSWESQSHSSTNSVRNSSKSSAVHMITEDQTGGQKVSICQSQSEVKMSTNEFLLGLRNNGVMGVPISFLDKFCPEQFEIVGATESEGKGFSNGIWNIDSMVAQPLIAGKKIYKRIFIKFKENN